MCASTLWPFSSSTRNMAFGSGSTTVPSTRIASSLGFARGNHLRFQRFGAASVRQAARARPLSISRIAPSRRSRRAREASGDREHLRTVVGHGNRVLEVGRERAVAGDDRPAVVEGLGLGLAVVYHRLASQAVPLLAPHPPARLAVVRDGRL